MNSNSTRAFQHVKAILGKLERSIDDARRKRTEPESAPADPAPEPQTTPGPMRATPIRRENTLNWGG